MKTDEAKMIKKLGEIADLIFQKAKKSVQQHICDISYNQMGLDPYNNFKICFSLCTLEYPGTYKYLPEQILVIPADSSQDKIEKLIKKHFELEKEKEMKQELDEYNKFIKRIEAAKKVKERRK